MRTYLTILLTLACASATLAIVCLPDTCASVQCALSTEEACLTRGAPGQYEFQAKGGFCGCCSNCVRVLAENESCFGTLLRGVPPTVKCADGFHCNIQSRVCVKNPTLV